MCVDENRILALSFHDDRRSCAGLGDHEQPVFAFKRLAPREREITERALGDDFRELLLIHASKLLGERSSSGPRSELGIGFDDRCHRARRDAHDPVARPSLGGALEHVVDLPAGWPSRRATES
ncbi:hypothetical protein HRbin41_00727 [bacterium HR41]|nr:hypothetical protein HRbin41_00727 [bacterium HR41]